MHSTIAPALQDAAFAAAYLGAAVAFGHPVSAALQAELMAHLQPDQDCSMQQLYADMQHLSSALLSLARMGCLPSALWQQHCSRMETALATRPSGE